MKTFEDYALSVELEAELRQLAADFERERRSEERRRETCRLVKESVRRYRTRRRIKTWLARAAVAGFLILAALSRLL